MFKKNKKFNIWYMFELTLGLLCLFPFETYGYM